MNVIEIEDLSKRYVLGEISSRNFLRNWAAKLGGRNSDAKEFWALRDIGLEIRQGDVLGIVGKNGAGKSTLLKIIAQIMAPTTGKIRIRGRIASLLEVGTGFHPELTGRDNVFLNGAILGMSQREVAAKFDAIAEFSGIENFLDTPVKRYSSGMRVRLAFAVAAHLDADIMIIDEVLAVGDAAFQQKCLGKIGESSAAGRTVLFVSHHAAAIASFCTRGIVIQQGRLVFDGTQTEALNHYHQSIAPNVQTLLEREDRTGSGELKITSIEFRDAEGRALGSVQSGQDVHVCLFFENHGLRANAPLSVRINVSTPQGIPVFSHGNNLTGTNFGPLPPKGAFVCKIPALPLPPASYNVDYRLSSDFRNTDAMDALTNAVTLHVEGGDFFGSGIFPTIRGGVTFVKAAWNLDTESEPHGL